VQYCDRSSGGGSACVSKATELLREISVERQVTAGSNLFLDGDAPLGVFFVISGRIDMSVANRVGRTRQVCMGCAGDVLGLSSSITGKPLDCRADVVEDSTVQFVPRDALLEFIRTSPEAHLEIVKILSLDIGRCYEVLKSIDAENRGHSLRVVPALGA
jgi:CRP-like cAMP-binding protein